MPAVQPQNSASTEMVSLQWKKSRKILLCVSGGIAAYKIPDLVSRLKKNGFEIEIVLTSAAAAFVSPLVLATLSGRKVWLDEDFLTADEGYKIPHIRLAEWADLIVIAPCSANTAADLACGKANSIIGAASLAARVPVVLFPAMNVNMLYHPATQKNLRTLSDYGVLIVDPEFGHLACGYDGKGRLPETDLILEEIYHALSPSRGLAGKHVIVTAGPTREFLDPVRFISNPSSGKMGLAMARTAWYRGADVRLILGPADLHAEMHGLQVINVVSALQMRDAVMENMAWADCIVKAAAVGDYRADEIAEHKIKREKKQTMSLELVQNPDIAAEVGAHKRPGQLLIGFAAETDDVVKNARMKMERKGLDIMLANDITAAGSGFGVDTNTVRMISRSCEMTLSGTKEAVADAVWERVLSGGLI